MRKHGKAFNYFFASGIKDSNAPLWRRVPMIWLYVSVMFIMLICVAMFMVFYDKGGIELLLHL